MYELYRAANAKSFRPFWLAILGQSLLLYQNSLQTALSVMLSVSAWRSMPRGRMARSKARDRFVIPRGGIV